MAFSTRWQSRVKLGNNLYAISASGFSVSVRFFPIYRVPHFGAVLGVRSPAGDFAVGQWLVTKDTKDSPSWAKPAVGLIVGSTLEKYVAEGSLRINEWNHLAVVFVPAKGWTVYLNGVPMGTIPDSGFRASGEISIGRIAQSDKLSQFYGLIDDVAVFDQALTPVEVKSYAALTSLTGSEAGLKWGWSFDSPNEVMNAQSQVPVIEGNAVNVQVSPTRSPSDQYEMPVPVQSVAYELPIPYEAEYYVVQGNSGNSHHWDRFAFTWDLIYAGQRIDPLNLRTASGNFRATDLLNKRLGQGQPLVSIADGTAVHANWNFVEGDGSEVPNATIIRHGPSEYSVYYHLMKDTFPALFPWPSPKQPFTVTASDFAAIDNGTIPVTYPKVTAGQKVGGLGGTGMKECKECYHLHFGVLDQPDLRFFGDRISRPIHFKSFEFSTDRINWRTMSGVPQEGTFIRRKTMRTGPIKTPNN
ncbi:MAG: LamG-like jellyroll fold domain-containing protein [Pyrinomonadaceae bacterium]